MRVIGYLHNYPPGRLLGGELMTSILLEALVEAGHEVDVIVHECVEARTRNGVRVLPRRKAMLSWDMRGYDLFVSHPEIAGFVRGRVGHAPFVGVVHNLSTPTLDALRLVRPTMLVANAQATANRVRGYCRDIMVLHPPTPVGRFPMPDGMPRRFVTQVNLSKEKGGELFYALAEARPDLPFLGVAGGHGEQIYPDPLPANVSLIGQSQSMGLIYAMTRVLLFGSSTETYGMVAAEACMAGIPVIAHRLPGIVEAIGDAALWRDRDHPEQWLDALTLLDDEDEWQAAAAKAAERGRFLAQRSQDGIDAFVTRVEALASSSAKTA